MARLESFLFRTSGGLSLGGHAVPRCEKDRGKSTLYICGRNLLISHISGWFPVPLEFCVLSQSDQGITFANKVAGLVIKISLDQELAIAEALAYQQLSSHSIRFVPRCYGQVTDNFTGATGLLLSFEGEPIEGDLSSSDWQVTLCPFWPHLF